METYVFGRIDKEAAKALDVFGKYSNYCDEVHEAFRPMVQFLGAQRFRTPHGLDWIKRHVGSADHNRSSGDCGATRAGENCGRYRLEADRRALYGELVRACPSATVALTHA